MWLEAEKGTSNPTLLLCLSFFVFSEHLRGEDQIPIAPWAAPCHSSKATLRAPVGLSTLNCPLTLPQPRVGLGNWCVLGRGWGGGEAFVVFHGSQLQILQVM